MYIQPIKNKPKLDIELTPFGSTNTFECWCTGSSPERADHSRRVSSFLLLHARRTTKKPAGSRSAGFPLCVRKKRGVAFRVSTLASLNLGPGDGSRFSRFRAFAIPEAVRWPRRPWSLGAVSLPSDLPDRRCMLSTTRRIRFPHDVFRCGGATPVYIISQHPSFCRFYSRHTYLPICKHSFCNSAYKIVLDPPGKRDHGWSIVSQRTPSPQKTTMNWGQRKDLWKP